MIIRVFVSVFEIFILYNTILTAEEAGIRSMSFSSTALIKIGHLTIDIPHFKTLRRVLKLFPLYARKYVIARRGRCWRKEEAEYFLKFL
jgi:hypothetical protein